MNGRGAEGGAEPDVLDSVRLGAMYVLCGDHWGGSCGLWSRYENSTAVNVKLHL